MSGLLAENRCFYAFSAGKTRQRTINHARSRVYPWVLSTSSGCPENNMAMILFSLLGPVRRVISKVSVTYALVAEPSWTMPENPKNPTAIIDNVFIFRPQTAQEKTCAIPPTIEPSGGIKATDRFNQRFSPVSFLDMVRLGIVVFCIRFRTSL